VSATKPTLSSANSLRVVTRSASDVPHRSKRHTSTASTWRRRGCVDYFSRSSRCAARADFLDLQCNRPATCGGIFAHSAHLRWQRLLIVSRHASVPKLKSAVLFSCVQACRYSQMDVSGTPMTRNAGWELVTNLVTRGLAGSAYQTHTKGDMLGIATRQKPNELSPIC
jgi:hypothetical protein